MSESPLVLIAEDEAPMLRLLETLLRGHGYAVWSTSSGEDAIVQTATRNPAVLLVDLGLPDIDGVEVVRRVREWSRVPILIVSAQGLEADKVRALDAGADDYLTKPFGSEELLARIRAALRRVQRTPDDPRLVVGELSIDLSTREVRRGEEALRLTPIEFNLLALLARNAGKVLTHREILREVWGPAHVDQVHYVRVYAAQLRRKLEQDPARPRYLKTHVGVGYTLDDGGS